MNASQVGVKLAIYKLWGYYPWLRLSMIKSLLLKLVMDTNHGVQQLFKASQFALLSLSFICSAMKTSVYLLRVLIIDVYGILNWDLPTVSHSQRSFARTTTHSISALIHIKIFLLLAFDKLACLPISISFCKWDL